MSSSRAQMVAGPDSFGSLKGLADAAIQRGDLSVAGKWWEDFCAQHPEDPAAIAELADVLLRQKKLREADEVVSAALLRLPSAFILLRKSATISDAKKDWDESLRRWKTVVDQFPWNAGGYVGAGNAARCLGSLTEASAILGEATIRFPENLAVAISYAYAAEREDLEQALVRWRYVREHFPAEPRGYLGEAANLRLLNRFEEADELLEGAVRRFPSDTRVLAQYAEVPAQTKNYPVAYDRANVLRSTVPTAPEGHLLLARYLQAMGRREEADEVLSDAVTLLPNNSNVLMRHAQSARNLGRWTEARHRWSKMKARFPQLPHGYCGVGEALRRLGEFDESESLMLDAVKRFPNHADVLVNYALVAHDRGDWRSAHSRWEKVRSVAPNHPTLLQRSGDAILFKSLNAIDDASASTPPSARLARTELQVDGKTLHLEGRTPECLQAFYMKFEGLGSDCEFGLLQRHYKAEPIGLLRFIDISPDALIRAIEQEFEGVGELKNTVLTRREDGEYQTRDTRYVMTTHTCIREEQKDPDKFLATACRRIRYLRDKLLDDLQLGEKIFVYQSHSMTDEQIASLHRGVRLYGKRSVLLCVRRSIPGKASGSVEYMGDGLVVGWRNARGRKNEGWDIDYDEWTRICKATTEAIIF